MGNKLKLNKKIMIALSIITVVLTVAITEAVIKPMNNTQNTISTNTKSFTIDDIMTVTTAKNLLSFEKEPTAFENRPEKNIEYLPIVNEFEAPAYQDKIFKDSKTNKELCYRLYLPENYSSSKKYPVLLFMHGVGGVGTNYSGATYSLNLIFSNNADIVKNAIIVAPQAPDSEGYWPIDDGLTKESGWGAIAMRLLLEIENTYSCDKDRIYITGNSMGGHGTWNLLETYNEHFAAGLPICGWSNPLSAGIFKNTPIWIYHGDQDPTVPVSASRLMYEAIKTIGSKKIHYTELKGVAHDSWPAAYQNREVISWLFSQHKTKNPNSEYETIPYLTIRDPEGKIVISEKDTTLISYTTIDSEDYLELKLTEDGTKKLESAYKNSQGKSFNVYFGNKNIMRFTAENGSINNVFYIVGGFDSLTYYEYLEKINNYTN